MRLESLIRLQYSPTMDCNETSLCYLLDCRSGELATQKTLLQTVVGQPVCNIQHDTHHITHATCCYLHL